MKKMYRRTGLYFLFTIVFTTHLLFLDAETLAQTSSVQTDGIPEGFYAYKLENGLELYVQEDFTTPTVRIEYVTKAGTQRQTSEMTGFYQLYTRLFWQNTVPGVAAYHDVGAGSFAAQGGTSQSRYSFTVSVSSFQNTLALFADGLKNPNFSDTAIKTEFDTLKKEVSSWATSIPGFINSAVDARVFSSAPWTKDSGVYPALFASHPLEAVRQKLSYVGKTWYVPDQSAIFISGPLPVVTILSIAKIEFASWQSGYIIGTKSDASRAQSASSTVQNLVPREVVDQTDTSKKLFVLVSKDFSPDFIQAVLQYTAPGLGANNEYSAAAWAGSEIMQSKLISAGMNNSDTAFVADAADSRIIMQTLFDVQSLGENTNTSLLVPSFANIVKNTARSFSQNDLDNAKQRSLLFRNDAYTGSASFMDAVAANWAYGGIEYFFAWPKAVQSLELSSVQNIFNDPWIFVLMHPDMYTKNAEHFADVGYVEITPKTNAWYSPALVAIDIQAQAQNAEEIPPKNIESLPQAGSLASYTEYTKSLIKQYSLTSGIPVATQEIPATPWTSILLSIQGGEILHGSFKRGTETIAIQNLANTIQTNLTTLYRSGQITDLPDIQNETQLYSASFSLVCLSQDIPLVLQAIAEAFKNIDIILSRADELFLSEAYNWRITSGSLEYQLYGAAMETLYGGSVAEGFFDANTELLLNADYSDIRIASKALYDPARLSIVLSGNIQNDFEVELEKYFGKKAFTGIEKISMVSLISEIAPVFSPIEQIVRLRHTFLTDVPAEFAGARPQSLIPTTDFSDPAQLYFSSPALNTADEAIFTAVLYELADRLMLEFQSIREPPAETVAIVPGTGVYPVSSLRFGKVKSRERLKSTTEKVFTEILADLKDLAQTQGNALPDQNSQGQTINMLTSIKNRYTRILSRGTETLEDRSILIQQGLRFSNNPSRYLERYMIVENSTAQDFYDSFSHFMNESTLFWVFSADTDRY